MPREVKSYTSSIAASLQLMHKQASLAEAPQGRLSAGLAFFFSWLPAAPSLPSLPKLPPAVSSTASALRRLGVAAFQGSHSSASAVGLQALPGKLEDLEALSQNYRQLIEQLTLEETNNRVKGGKLSQKKTALRKKSQKKLAVLFQNKMSLIEDVIKTIEIDIGEINRKGKCGERTAADNARRDYLMRQADALQLQKVNLVPELIREHSQRRMDLFFLLMVALYKRGGKVTLGKTILQHGKGQGHRGTEACHASLFTNPQTTAQCQGLALSQTHFMDSLNMTTELPTAVNLVDCALEGNDHRSDLIEQLLVILNKVANGGLTPLNGLHRYLRCLERKFSAIEKDKQLPATTQPSDSLRYPRAFACALALEREGALSAAKRMDGRWCINPDYVAMQLGLAPLRSQSARDAVTYQQQTLLLAKAYSEVQQTIINTPSAR